MSERAKAMTVQDLLDFVRDPPLDSRFAHHKYHRQWADHTPQDVWVGWLREYSGPGHYHRKGSTDSARAVYNHVKSVPMLAWFCEQVGVPVAKLAEAASAASPVRSKAAQAAAFRRVIPWAEVDARLALRRIGRKRIDTPQQLRRIISRLSLSCPVTDRFSASWRRLASQGGQQERRHPPYKTQHDHWLRWLKGWNGAGAYGRKNWSRSAEFVYGHIVNPQMLIYLGEAAGVPKSVLLAAYRAGLGNAATMSAMSAAIRRVMPWPIIEWALVH
ncbi:MAG TPA: hypothetical protein VFX12_05445 [Vicinamibacterales bacterium]|nr:hypothetical protein [Vicinamibacterales bacterium]